MQKPTISQIESAWCELINPYNFFIVHVFHHTSRKTSRRDVEAPETLKRLGSFKVSASVSEAATSRLGLGSASDGLVHIPARMHKRTDHAAIKTAAICGLKLSDAALSQLMPLDACSEFEFDERQNVFNGLQV